MLKFSRASLALRGALLAAAVLLMPAQQAQAAVVVIDSYYTPDGTFQIRMQGDLLAMSTSTLTVSAPEGVSFMGYNLNIGGAGSGFLAGGDSVVITYSNTGMVDTILDAFLAFAAADWNALLPAVQNALLDPEGSPGTALISGFFEPTGSGGGTGGDIPDISAVPLGAALPFLLVGLGAFGLARRRKKN